MQVQYQLDVNDIVAFNLHHMRKSRNTRRRIRVTQAWGVGLALAVAVMLPRWGMGARTLFFTVYALFLLFWFPAYYRWSVERNTRKLYSEGQNKGVLGNHIVALAADGVTEISDVGESRTAWSGIEKVEANEDYIFLYTGSLQAHVIPKRAFLDEDEYAEFFQLARVYHSGSPRLTSG